MAAARHWIERLQLTPHPEGGYFRETYRSSEVIAGTALPSRFAGPRAFGTSIYYLLEVGDFSAFHRINQDEIWHWYAGGVLVIHVLTSEGVSSHRLGTGEGEQPQVVVHAGLLFAAEVEPGSEYVLAGCTVAPGFDFADLVMPSRADLVRQHPEQQALFERLTRH